MTKKSTCFLLKVLALAIGVSGCETMPEEPKQAESAPPAPACMPAGAPSDPDRPAQGSRLDSVEDCKARIPCDASENMRKFAENSCEAQFASEKRKDFDALKKNKRDFGGPLSD